MREIINTDQFSAVVTEFVNYNDLNDSVAKSGTTFNKVVDIVASSLKEQGYVFSDNCESFIKTLHRTHNRVMTKLGHNQKLRNLTC